jgi:hypothetical protein
MMGKTLLILLVAFPALATTHQKDRCNEVAYENNNQVDPSQLKVQKVRGIVTDPQQVPIPQACIALFTPKEHKLVATTESDDQGHFSLPNVRPGEYRLITKYDSLCTANVLLRVTRNKKNKTLHVHMKVSALDACSYIDLASNIRRDYKQTLTTNCRGGRKGSTAEGQ